MSYSYHDRINTHIIVNVTTNLENIFHADIEIQAIMKEFYIIKRNFISFLERTISFSFV